MAADRHTHNFRKRNHASVGLAQARPNHPTASNEIWCWPEHVLCSG